MYQATALQAFEFCLKYTRKTEFRRLCELLRNHVQNAAKYASQIHAINLNDPDTLQRHLDTRFQQLNVAVELELWQEAFRSVEDIHTLLNLSKRPAKNIMMANYYQNLTRIFMVSDNHLFHAAAWSRYFNLLRTSAAQVAANPALKKDSPATSDEDWTRVASLYLLAALSIPVISNARSKGALLDVDEAKRNKNTRLTNLLGMAKAPTRASLFKDILNKGIMKRARPEIRELYTILEVDFHPLSICKKIAPILTKIAGDADLKAYVQPLQQVILTRLFQQLSQVYDSVQLSFVLELASFPSPFEINPTTIEKFIMNGCKKGDLSIRIDHSAGVITFESDIFSSSKALHAGSAAGSAEKDTSVQKLQSTPSEIVRTQLSRIAKALYLTCTHVDPSFIAEKEAAKAAAQQRALDGARYEHQENITRRAIIEKKKEAAEAALLKKEKEEADQRAARAEAQKASEAARVAEQQKKREQERLKAEQERIRKEELKKQLDELALDAKIDLENLGDYDSNQLRQMKVQQLEKEKKEMADRLRLTGKRIDHLERAYRREEVKILPKDWERQQAEDLAAYEEAKKHTIDTAKAAHDQAVSLKNRLGRLVGDYEKFRDEIKANRSQEFEQRRKAAEKELQKAMDQRRKEYRAQKEKARLAEEAERERQRLAREAEEKRIRDEEERSAREAEEKARRDAEIRERMIREKEEAAEFTKYVPFPYTIKLQY
jgi:translation initiation factor 3 subunit A